MALFSILVKEKTINLIDFRASDTNVQAGSQNVRIGALVIDLNNI